MFKPSNRRLPVGRSCRLALLFLLAGAALAPARAQLPPQCKAALEEAARPASEYMCFANAGSNACHQTSTRTMAVFLAKTDPKKSATQARRLKIESIEALYADVCGAPLGPKSIACSPKVTAVYQLFISDSKDPQGHSFTLACLQAQGCVVLQGIAGAFGLQHWIGLTPTTNVAVAEAVKEFGGLKLLKDRPLHDWLVGARDLVEGRGTLRSVLAFGVCDRAYYGCSRIGKSKGWQELTWTTPGNKPGEKLPGVQSGVLGFRYAWDGGCDPFADTRKAGASYPSAYCTDDAILALKMPFVKTNLADRSGLCAMGLSTAGRVPANSSSGVCDAAGPVDLTARFAGKGLVKFTTPNSFELEVDPITLKEVGKGRAGSKRIVTCEHRKGTAYYEFVRQGALNTDTLYRFLGPAVPQVAKGAQLELSCRIAGEAGHPVVKFVAQTPGSSPGALKLTEPEKKLVGLMQADARYCESNSPSDGKEARRRKIYALATRLKVPNLPDRTTGDYVDLQARTLKVALPLR